MKKSPFLKTVRIPVNRKSFSSLPETPGVYCFLYSSRPIYIGKAINLRNRLKSYLLGVTDRKTRAMIKRSDSVTYIKVESELEALLLESELIRKFKPVYNIISKDDKHALYIKITNEKYPRVSTSRKVEAGKEKLLAYFGPFTSSAVVNRVLSMLRKIFPFADHKIGKKPCLASQIGLCDPCPNMIVNTDSSKLAHKLTNKYRKNIFLLINVLKRKNSSVLKYLFNRMNYYSMNAYFEEAAIYRNRIQMIKYITQPITDTNEFLKNPNFSEEIKNKEMEALRIFMKTKSGHSVKTSRIECFDVAHFSGLGAAASMVTFINGEPEKCLYRNLKIRGKNMKSDTSSLAEIATIRLKHLTDWGKPDLIIVDGGKGQVGVFVNIFKDQNIPIIGIAKREESLVIPFQNKFIVTKLPVGPALNLVVRIRNEAHRFAQRYHHHLFKQSLIS